MKTVLLTGATGFVGRHLSPHLVDLGYKVIGTSSQVKIDAHLQSCNLKDSAQIFHLVNAINPDIVIHAAALSSVTRGSTLDYYQTNVIATENLIRAIHSLSKRTRIIFLSTAGVYGTQGVDCLSEDMCPKPVSHYGMSKFVCERMMHAIRSNHDITILRPFNIIGHGQSEDFVVPKIVKHYAEKLSTITLGNIQPQRDYIGIDACCQIISALIPETRSYGEVVNVCSGQATSVADLIEILTKASGHTLRVESSPDLIRSNEIMRLIGSTTKLNLLISNRVMHKNIELLLIEMLNSYVD
jgi:GDP-6-deoxy-D-talose 4-dehydrogenase